MPLVRQSCNMVSVFSLFDERWITSDVIACCESLPSHSPLTYRQLAAVLVNMWRTNDQKVIGLAGGQGTGKTTLSSLIQTAGEAFGESIAVISLDDFYLTKAEREALARQVHPLLQTRGPPATHDTKKLEETILKLAAGESVVVPVFNKGLDDREGERSIEDGSTRIVIEGWCVGARTQNEEQLAQPINNLEAKQDTEGVWRRYVNSKLATEYSKIWSLLNSLIYLATPSMEHVVQWRLLQEKNLPQEHRKSEEWVREFIQYYERITRDMLVYDPGRVDMFVELDEDHQVKAIKSP